MKKQILFLIMFLPIVASAQDIVTIDNINYKLNPREGICEVTGGSYSGNVVIPASITFKGVDFSVTSIGEEAFSHSRQLTSVTIPYSVTNIGYNAFYYCDALTAVYISDLTAWCKVCIGQMAGPVSYGNYDYQYYVSSNPFYFNRHLFMGEEEITDLVIPNGVTKIGDYAFQGCRSLTSVTIPNSVTTIGEEAFDGCSGLTSVHISDLAAWLRIPFDFNSNPLYYAHHLYLGEEEIKDLVIPNSVKSIGNYVFSGCSGLTSVTIPNSVVSIGNGAFANCTGLTSVHISDLASWCRISFFSNPLDYAHHLYMGGKEISDLVIPNSVTSLNRTFSGCSGLTSVTIPNSVTSIGSSAFYGCSGLTSVTIPNSVTSIGGWAFADCSGLTSVIIPNSVTSIEAYAFRNCIGLTSVTIPNSVTLLKEGTFQGCSGLTNVLIPNGVINIEGEYDAALTPVDGVFSGCKSLTSVTIPNSVNKIGVNAFSGCSGLISVTIPNSVVSIGDGAFEKCTSLTSVMIPNSVMSIGNDAFRNCNALTSVTFGKGVTNIGGHAFASCSEIVNVYCMAEKVPSTSSDAFKGSYIGFATLYVPYQSVEAYSNDVPWSDFNSIIALHEKCATPDITFVDGELSFSCQTEGVEYVYEIVNGNPILGTGEKVKLNNTYTVIVYATKEGWENSDMATMEFTIRSGGDICDLNNDGTVDVADISTIIDKMASLVRLKQGLIKE